MNVNDLTIENGWQHAGKITLDDEGKRLTMPSDIPPEPGLYKLVFNDNTLYFGEAGDLQRRIGDYIVYYEGTGIESEFRINRALHECGGAQVFFYTGGDVRSRSERCQVEHRLIKAAGKRALNGGTIEDRIAFHATEIVRLSKKLKEKASTGERHA